MNLPIETLNEADALARLNAEITSGSFQHLLGLRFCAVGENFIEAKLQVTDALTSKAGAMHGGALMTFADSVGGIATRLLLEPGQSTTTLESKTNMFRPGSPGSWLTARAELLHRGRTTMVWQTTIRNPEGKTVSVTIQTQMIISDSPYRPSASG